MKTARSGVVSDVGRPGCTFPINGGGRAPRVAFDAAPKIPDTNEISAYDPFLSGIDAEEDPRIRKIAEFLKGKLSDADRATFIEMLRKQFSDEKQAADLPTPFPGMPTPGGGKIPWRERTDSDYALEFSGRTPAMDRRTTFAADAASRSAIRSVNEYRAAQADVAPIVGHIAADSADEVYRAALRTMGADPRGIAPGACQGAFDAIVRNGLHRGERRPATTAAGAASFKELFPDAVPMRTV